MSIVSPILNSVSFKTVGGTYPNKWNRLHSDRKQGGFTVLNYCQKFPKDHPLYMQFISPDDDTVPTMIIYFNDGSTKTIVGTLADKVIGDQTRYWFNFNISLTTDYYDQVFTIKVGQGATVLTSEPVYVYDMAEDIEKGIMRYCKYTNLDRNVADLDGYFVRWSVIDNTGNYLDFFIEASDRESSNTSSSAILEGAQSRTIIASKLYSGISLKTDILPEFMILKLTSAVLLDQFYLNDIQYVIDGDADQAIVGGSTSNTAEIALKEKNTLGINVDDLGIEDMAQSGVINRVFEGVSADFDLEKHERYVLHTVLVRHNGLSSGNDATVTCGNSIGSSEYIDSFSGLIKDDGKFHSFIPHNSPDLNFGRLYFGISGSGVVLDVYVQFINVTE